MAHTSSRGIALSFLDHGTRRGWGVSFTPWPLFTPGKHPVPIIQEAGWTPGPVWPGAENIAPPGFDPRTVQPVDSRYTDWATGPTEQVKVSSNNNNGYLSWSTVYIYDTIYFWFLVRTRNVSHKVVEKIKTHILCSIIFFLQKYWGSWDNVGKYCRAEQVTDDNMTHAHCMLKT
jgi:hypothetical protein